MKSDFVFALGVAFGLTILAVAAAIFDLPGAGSATSAFPAILMFFLFAWLFFRVGSAAFKRYLSARYAFLLGCAAGVIHLAIAAAFVHFASPNGEMRGLVALPFLLAPILIFSFLAPLAARKAMGAAM